MGKKTTTDTKQKKKKGRPSLLDLQKRKQLQNPNSNSRSPNPTPTRRSTRRNPNSEADQIEEESQGEEQEEEDDDDDEESNGKRKEKKLKLVLKVQPRSSPRNPSGGADAASDRSDGSDEEGPVRKRKINAVGNDGGDRSENEKADRHNSAQKATDPSPGTASVLGSITTLPDKQLLLAILDRLQKYLPCWVPSFQWLRCIVKFAIQLPDGVKKDTYSVFAEPVDPAELPDYHEVIDHPMDFGTVRNKLFSGAYANLEQFEKDVFLISSNAMKYNAQDTIYFRQARSIQELAKKGFESLKQGKDDNKPEVKTVRRGRPPGKSSGARSVGRPLDRSGPDFSSDATLAAAVDNTVRANSILDFSRNSVLSDKFSITDLSARVSQGSNNNEKFSWQAEYRPNRTDEFSGSTLKGMSKLGKKQAVVDDNRRSTYEYSLESTSGHEASVLKTFDAERKQLIPLGLHMEHMYARSLARFAANLGPVAWKVAFRKIEKVLPAGMKFGPGWVGEEEMQPQRPRQVVSPLRQMQPASLPPPQMATWQSKIRSETNGDGISERHESSSGLDVHSSRICPPSASVSAVPNKSHNPAELSHSATSGNSSSVLSFISSRGSAPLRPHFQLCQKPAMYPTLNGFKSFSPPSQVGKPTGPSRPPSSFSFEASIPCGMPEMGSGSNSGIHPGPTNHFQADSKLTGRSSGSLRGSNREGQISQLAQATWPHSRPDSAPPDLNVGFQSPASPPTAGSLVDSQQPDLALQL